MKPKRTLKIILITIIVALSLFIILFYAMILYSNIINEIENNEPEKIIEYKRVKVTKNAVIVKIWKDSNMLHLGVMTIEDEPNCYRIVTAGPKIKENYKIGQEIQFDYEYSYSTGEEFSANMYFPIPMLGVDEIRILKEESEIEIPDSILHDFYENWDNIEVKINEISVSKISFTIDDSNEEPYNYSSDDCKIYKKNNGTYELLANSVKKDNNKQEDSSSESCVTKSHKYKKLSNR